MPVIRLDINDDEEFTSCNVCKSSVQRYNNTSLSTAPIHTLYTKTLLSYHHLNCHKCGLYIEIHPMNPADEGLIFLCSNSIPCEHALCYECGLLYDLDPDDKKSNILNQLQYNNTTTNTNPVLEPKPATSNVLDGLTNVGIVSNGTFIAEVMQEMVQSGANHKHDNENMQDGWTLIIGTIMALFVWFGIYWSSPELFRLTGCFVWFTIFYFVTSLFFTENESIQRSVFSLFGFSPIVASIYLLEKTRRYPAEWQQDISTSVQFLCVFGCIAYFSCYWNPLEMYLFLANDFVMLSFMEQSVSLFITVSIASFICILCSNCGLSMDAVNVWWMKQKEDDDMQIDEIITELQITSHSTKETETENKTKKKRKRRRRRKKKKHHADIVECH